MGQQGSTEAAGAGASGAGGGASAQRAVPQKGMMRAWVMETPGDIDELSPKDNITVPTPGPGEVRVKVMAAGLNMSDVRRVREAGMAFPAAVGLDGAGIVDAVGPEAAGGSGEVGRPEVGTRVYFTCDSALAYGTLAEYTIVSAHRVFPVLGEVSFATAAALPSSGWAAYLAVREKLQVSRGKSIYITGGAGGVGGYAVSLCKGEGLTVITSCSSYNTPYALERGADHVLDYTSDDIAAEVARLTDGRGVDYVLDTIGSETATANARLLAHNGQICSTNGPVMFTEDLVLRGTSVHYIYLNGLLESPHHRAVVKDIADTVMQLTATGELRSNVGEVGKWDRVREALHALESRHVRGKLVISIEPLHRARAKAESAQAAAGTAEEYVVVSSAAELESMLVGNPKLVSTESVLATAGKRCHVVERDGDVVRVLHENLHCWLPMAALTKVSDDAAPTDSASAEAAPSADADADCSRKPSGDGVPPPVAPSPSIPTAAAPAADPQTDAATAPADAPSAGGPAAPLAQPAVKQPPQQLPTPQQQQQPPVKPSYPSYPQPPQPPQGVFNPRGAAGGVPHQSYGHSAAPVTTAPAASNPVAPQQPGKDVVETPHQTSHIYYDMAPRNRGGARKGGAKVSGKAKGGAVAEDDYLPSYLKNVPNLPWHPEATRTGLRIFSFVMLAIFAFMLYTEQMKHIPTAVPGGKVYLTRQMTVDPADDDSQGAVFPEGMEGTFVSYPTGNAVPEFGTVVLNGMEFQLPCDSFRVAAVEESSEGKPSGEADL